MPNASQLDSGPGAVAVAGTAPGIRRGLLQAALVTVVLADGLAAASEARKIMRSALSPWSALAASEDAVLAASELVANALLHGRGPVTLSLSIRRKLRGGARLTCEVADSCPALPAPRATEPDDENGRGLAIVNALAASWGVREAPHGKAAWFCMTLPRIPGRHGGGRAPTRSDTGTTAMLRSDGGPRPRGQGRGPAPAAGLPGLKLAWSQLGKREAGAPGLRSHHGE